MLRENVLCFSLCPLSLVMLGQGNCVLFMHKIVLQDCNEICQHTLCNLFSDAFLKPLVAELLKWAITVTEESLSEFYQGQKCIMALSALQDKNCCHTCCRGDKQGFSVQAELRSKWFILITAPQEKEMSSNVWHCQGQRSRFKPCNLKVSIEFSRKYFCAVYFFLISLIELFLFSNSVFPSCFWYSFLVGLKVASLNQSMVSAKTMEVKRMHEQLG